MLAISRRPSARGAPAGSPIRRHPAIGADRRVCDSGVEAVEFALVLPVLLTLLFGIISLAITFYHYELLINAAEAGCRYFASARGSTAATPASSTVTTIQNAAGGLPSTAFTLNTGGTNTGTVYLSINGTQCTTDTACNTALSLGPGNSATVKINYPCTIFVMGVNFAPNCVLTQSVTEIVE